MWPDTILETSQAAAERAIDFADPMGSFQRAVVYVEFDSAGRGAVPVTREMPGYPGAWVVAFTTAGRLSAAHVGEDVEYSWMPGSRLLPLLPAQAGLWCDPGLPGGHAIVLPTPLWPTDSA
jgi:hypothetical protein